MISRERGIFQRATIEEMKRCEERMGEKCRDGASSDKKRKIKEGRREVSEEKTKTEERSRRQKEWQMKKDGRKR